MDILDIKIVADSGFDPKPIDELSDNFVILVKINYYDMLKNAEKRGWGFLGGPASIAQHTKGYVTTKLTKLVQYVLGGFDSDRIVVEFSGI